MKAIGLDIGTTTICGVLIDGNKGELLQRITLPNNTALSSDNPFEKLQDAIKIEAMCRQILDAFMNKFENIVSIGVTGQMHGVLYIDQNGNAVSPLVTWQDQRGNQPHSQSGTYAEHLSMLTGYKLATGFGAVTHYYNTINGLIPDQAVRMCTIPDYVAMRIANRKTPLIHASMAASMGLYSLTEKQFDEQQITAAEMQVQFFPEIQKVEEPIGLYRGSVTISAALGDNQASFYGSMEGNSSILVNVGTGSQISVLGTEIGSFDCLECRPYVGDNYLYVGSSLCGGYAYSLLKSLFEDVFQMCGEQVPENLYGAMNRVGAEAKEKATPRLRIDVRFNGSRKEPTRRGKIEGVSPENFRAGDMVLGVLRGICEELYKFYSELEVQKRPEYIMGSGNGIRRNPLLKQLFEERFGTQLRIPACEEEAAFGAARFALKQREENEQ